MKYVILKLLRTSHVMGMNHEGLEERMHGCYSPSPGTVYPTLQWLEDEDLVVARDVEGKKVYEITDTGRASWTSTRHRRRHLRSPCGRRSAYRRRLDGGSEPRPWAAGEDGHVQRWKAEGDDARKRLAEIWRRHRGHRRDCQSDQQSNA